MKVVLKSNKPWWRFWKTSEEKETKAYFDGYDWAAGKLLRGCSEYEINRYVHKLEDSFDIGARDAMYKFSQLVTHLP